MKSALETNFFGTPGSSSYYLPSTTFSELVNERKDLCVIAIANVTIASITVNTVTDMSYDGDGIINNEGISINRNSGIISFPNILSKHAYL